MNSAPWIIAKKEIKLLFKSTRRIFLLFTTPLILLVIFLISVFLLAIMIPELDKPIEVTVIQDDSGFDGTNWGDGLYISLKNHNLTKNLVYVNRSESELNNLLESKNYTILLYIPANFSETINQSVPAQFYMYYESNYESVISILTVSQIYNQYLFTLYHPGVTTTKLYVIPEGAGETAGFEGIVASYITLIPLYLIIFLVVPSLSLVLISVTIEREQKTLESLILQPIERKSIIAGKLLYGAILVGVNTISTLVSFLVILVVGYFMLPKEVIDDATPVIQELVGNADISVYLFLLFMLLGLILVSLLTITAAVMFSLLAKDEREANMVVSAMVIVPLVSTLLITFLPIDLIPEILHIILVALPLLGYLFAIYFAFVSGELAVISWFSLLAQLLWTLLGVWGAGRLMESEGILEISYKKIFRRSK